MNGTPNDSAFLNSRFHIEQPETGICKRDDFQRDRDRIMHSRAFRRMMHKTQIFNANMGDHYRNRLTHTLEVSQIARSIGKALDLNDELIEAIALGHDLGHTPFGHVGERTLNSILLGDDEKSRIDGMPITDQGFKHNLQSIRIVDDLESRCSDYAGLNLTLAVREGILKHTSLSIDKKRVNYSCMNLNNINIESCSFTFEGQVVALADEIAQCTHDLEDGVRSNIISFDTIINDPFVKNVCEEYGIDPYGIKVKTAYSTRSLIIKSMVGVFIKKACEESSKNIENYINSYSPKYSSLNDCISEKCVVLPKEVEEDRKRIYNDIIKSQVINSEATSISDSKSEYIIKQLFKAFYNHPKQLPDYILNRYLRKKGIILNRARLDENELREDPMFIRTICDHISGMTDQFAAREYKKLYMPDYV